MNYTELLEDTMRIGIEMIPINVVTPVMDFNMAFIEFEDFEKLGLAVTGEDGRERFNIVMKKDIVAIQVLYEEDIVLNFGVEEDIDVMFD